MNLKPLTIAELVDGVAFWRTKKTWRRDFHNADYERWTRQNPNGDFTLAWWPGFLARLQAWKATRPVSGADLTARFSEHAPALGEAWRQACGPCQGRDIGTVEWEEIKAFPDEVAKIKPTKSPSPVFTSKFCHFLFPEVFPVLDNDGLGNGWPTYEEYYRFVRQTWRLTDPAVHVQLTAEMRQQIEKAGRPVFSGFPMTNKITELCLIGRRHRPSASPGLASPATPTPPNVSHLHSLKPAARLVTAKQDVD